MATVLNDISSNLDESVSLLQELNRTAGTTTVQIQGLMTKLKQGTTDISATGTALRSGIQSLGTSIGSIQSEVEVSRQQVTERANQNARSAADLIDRLVTSHQSTQTRISDAEQGLGKALETMVDRVDEVRTHFEASSKSVEQSLEGARRDQENVERSLSSLRDKTRSLHSRLDANRSETTKVSEAFERHLHQIGSVSMKSAFARVTTEVKGEHREAVRKAFTDATSRGEGALHQFSSDCTGQAATLIETAGTTFHRVCSVTAETLPAEIRQSVQSEALRAAEALLENIGKTITLAGVGAAVTTPLSPWLPEILVVRKMLHAINFVTGG